MLEAWQTLNASKQNNKSSLTNEDFNKVWVAANPYNSSTYTTTALSATSGTNLSSV
jgi:hypothetical protein